MESTITKLLNKYGEEKTEAILNNLLLHDDLAERVRRNEGLVPVEKSRLIYFLSYITHPSFLSVCAIIKELLDQLIVSPQKVEPDYSEIAVKEEKLVEFKIRNTIRMCEVLVAED